MGARCDLKSLSGGGMFAGPGQVRKLPRLEEFRKQHLRVSESSSYNLCWSNAPSDRELLCGPGQVRKLPQRRRSENSVGVFQKPVRGFKVEGRLSRARGCRVHLKS
eukprot:7247069-Prorocentrum_lima.AAC.1